MANEPQDETLPAWASDGMDDMGEYVEYAELDAALAAGLIQARL